MRRWKPKEKGSFAGLLIRRGQIEVEILWNL